MKKTPKEDYELLYESLLQLKSVEECRKFMETYAPSPSSRPWASGSRWPCTCGRG